MEANKKQDFIANAPKWFCDAKLLENFAKENGCNELKWKHALAEISRKVIQNPEDQNGRSFIPERKGLGVITAEGHNGGEGAYYWTFRPHNFNSPDGFPLDYNKVFSFYDHDLNLVNECRLSDLSGAEATQLFKNYWTISHKGII